MIIDDDERVEGEGGEGCVADVWPYPCYSLSRLSQFNPFCDLNLS